MRGEGCVVWFMGSSCAHLKSASYTRPSYIPSAEFRYWSLLANVVRICKYGGECGVCVTVSKKST